MSSNDKTGEKLVASMRKTKADAADKSAASQGGSQASQKSESPKSESPKSESKAQPKKKAESKRPQGGTAKRAADPYQTGRRVWPD